MFPKKHLFTILIISISLIHLSKASKNSKQKSSDYINCKNFTHIKKPFDIVLEQEEYNFENNPEPIETIMTKVNHNSEKIRYSLCQLKADLEKDIYRSELSADTFNNDRLEQLDGTVTSRKVGSVLRRTVLKVGECVSNVAKLVLVLPIKIKPEVPCVMKELITLKKFSTEVAQVITGAMKSIVNYPRDMADCFKTEGKTNCLSKLHKKVIRNTTTNIMEVVQKSLETEETLQTMAETRHKCSEYGTSISKLAMIPLSLSQCIYNKIY